MRGVAVDGEFVKERRRTLGLTQESLAIRVDCDVRTIRNAERGNNVDATTLKAIATALDVALSDVAKTKSFDRSDRENVACIQRWQAAFFAGDVESLVGTYATEGSLQLPSAQPVRGHAALSAAYRKTFGEYAFEIAADPKISVEKDRVFLESGAVRITILSRDTIVEAAAVHVFLMDEAKIIEHAAFYDTSPFMDLS